MNRPIHRRAAARRTLATLFAAAAILQMGPANAQAPAAALGGWPAKPVKFIVPSGAGAQTDLFARYIAEHLSKAFGQPFVVENKHGASGAIGAMAVAKAAPDGYSLLFSASSFTVVPAALKPNQPYDLLKELVPVARIGVGGLFLAVHPEFPAQSMKALFDLARAEPDKHSFGSTGNGSTGHIIMASLLKQQGLKMSHVPYKSSAEVARDLSGGVIKVGWVDTSSSLGLIQGGKIKPLAIGSTYKAPANPDVPTFNELGYPMHLNGWLGVFATAGTPAPIVAAVNAEVNKLLATDESHKRLLAMNVANAPGLSSEQFTQFVRTELQNWRKVVVDNNIQVD